MNERLNTVVFETEPLPNDHNVERSIGRNALQTLQVEKEPVDAAYIAQGVFEVEQHANDRESIKRPDGIVYAQDQEEYKSYAALATNIVMEAFTGDLEALNRIPNTRIRNALRDRILSGNSEIEKMISVACIGLANEVE